MTGHQQNRVPRQGSEGFTQTKHHGSHPRALDAQPVPMSIARITFRKNSDWDTHTLRAVSVGGYPLRARTNMIFTTLGGRRSAVVVPDLGPLLFEGVRSGTLETERSRPPPQVTCTFPEAAMRTAPGRPGAVLSRSCPAAVRLVPGVRGAASAPYGSLFSSPRCITGTAGMGRGRSAGRRG